MSSWNEGCNFWLISGWFAWYFASLWVIWLVCEWFGWFVDGLDGLWVVSSYTANDNFLQEQSKISLISFATMQRDCNGYGGKTF